MNTTTNKPQSITDLFGPVIYSYTRKQAIEDGFLTNITELFPDKTTIFRHPVCITHAVSVLIEGNNMGSWCWDLCYMAAKWHTKVLSESSVLFKVNLPRKQGQLATKGYELKCMVHPGDNGEPVVTISFPNED